MSTEKIAAKFINNCMTTILGFRKTILNLEASKILWINLSCLLILLNFFTYRIMSKRIDTAEHFIKVYENMANPIAEELKSCRSDHIAAVAGIETEHNKMLKAAIEKDPTIIPSHLR